VLRLSCGRSVLFLNLLDLRPDRVSDLLGPLPVSFLALDIGLSYLSAQLKRLLTTLLSRCHMLRLTLTRLHHVEACSVGPYHLFLIANFVHLLPHGAALLASEPEVKIPHRLSGRLRVRSRCLFERSVVSTSRLPERSRLATRRLLLFSRYSLNVLGKNNCAGA
jgi:hypothetical protein